MRATQRSETNNTQKLKQKRAAAAAAASKEAWKRGGKRIQKL